MTMEYERKVANMISLAKACEVKTRKNLMRDLPKLESTLLTITEDLYDAIGGLPGLDPRKFGAKAKYGVLCEGTAMACKFFHAYLRGAKYQGYIVTEKDVLEAINAWIEELNKWATPKASFWSSMRGRVLHLKVNIDQPSKRFNAVEEFIIEIEERNKVA